MKVRVIKTFTDRYSVQSIKKGTMMKITEERFGELTAGPLGIFVEKLPGEKNKPKQSKKKVYKK